MSKPNPPGQTGSPEPLIEWEGPAVNEPGVLFEERQAEHLSTEVAAVELAAWIAQVALGGVIGNAVYATIRAKVVGVLSAWRRRFGQVKIDEVKEQLLRDMQHYRNNRKITDEELRERIDLLFDEVNE
jgi:hypothetical protein